MGRVLRFDGRRRGGVRVPGRGAAGRRPPMDLLRLTGRDGRGEVRRRRRSLDSVASPRRRDGVQRGRMDQLGWGPGGAVGRGWRVVLIFFLPDLFSFPHNILQKLIFFFLYL